MIKVEMTLSFDDWESATPEEVEKEIREAVCGQYMDVESIKVTKDGRKPE